jgi:hypothetical protein
VISTHPTLRGVCAVILICIDGQCIFYKKYNYMSESTKAGFAGAAGAMFVVGLFMVATGHISTAPQASAENLAASPEKAVHLDFGQQLAAANCNGVGAPVVNVTEKISNDADSGIAGNYWGLDSFTRSIQVWKTADKTYCAMVRYEGKFAGIAGQRSPGNTGVLTGSETGVVTGGYQATITNATLLATPTWKTNGNVGSFDYQCDAANNCPGAVNWLDQYFAPGYGFDQPWWGWIYRAGGNKVWVNAVTGNLGDII